MIFEDESDEKVELFYDQIDYITKVLGDFNARISEGECDTYGLENRNERIIYFYSTKRKMILQ